MAIKAADMLIARRADTRARADFATWKMLAKLNGASALPAEAQNFLVSYRKMLEKMADANASEANIQLMYKSYYIEMGGAGTPPEPRRAATPFPTPATSLRFAGRPPPKPAALSDETEARGTDFYVPRWCMSASMAVAARPTRISQAAQYLPIQDRRDQRQSLRRHQRCPPPDRFIAEVHNKDGCTRRSICYN